MKVHILHDEHGKIIAISKEVDLKQAETKLIKTGMLPGKGQFMFRSCESPKASKRRLCL